MTKKIYVNDIGTAIEIPCGEDISTATGHKLFVKKPDDTEVEWTTVIVSGTSLRHVTVSGDCNMAGTYYVQPYMTIGSWTGRGNTVSFEVYPKFT